MYSVLHLNGEWVLEGKGKEENPIHIRAKVPGYVHPALECAGILEPYFWRDNAELCQWVEKREWIFWRQFEIADTTDLSGAELRIGGVDTYADIYVNDIPVTTSSNMYIPICTPVSHALHSGVNTIRIVIHPYHAFVSRKPREINSAFSDDRIHVRRIQCTFFWDWVNRFVSAGIIGDVTLAFPKQACITDVFTQTKDFCRTSAAVDLQITTARALETDCRFAAEIRDPMDKPVWCLKGNVYAKTLYLQADLPEPQLWWPVGYGEHPLYTLSVTLYGQDGEEIDRKSQRFGIRTVRFERLQDVPGSSEEARTHAVRQELGDTGNPCVGESFVLLVNGERIFAKGANWVPASPFVAEVTRERYYELVALAAKGNMNLLRVWGGGIYESDDFYDACDALGVMVTQDFMLACAIYPDTDPEFIENFTKEVEAVVTRLRSRTSLAAWLGNNENGDFNNWDDKNTRNILLSEGVCRSILARLDPNRTFRSSCPFGGNPNTDFTVGDNHVSWWWRGAENITPKTFHTVGRFASESPMEGYPLPSTLRHFLTDADIFDFDSPVVDYHIKNNYYMEELGWPSVHQRLKKNANIMVGVHSDPQRQLYRWAYIQYEWARFTLEAIRLAKWYSAGVQYWMYNDCWPALGYAVVDYYCKPKAGWYATKYSGAPIAAAIRQKGNALECVLLNDSFAHGEIAYRVWLYEEATGGKEILAGTESFAKNENCLLCEINLSDLALGEKGGVLFLDLYQSGKRISRARWYPHWLADVALPDCELEYRVDTDANTICVSCCKGIAIGVAFDGELVAEENFFDLLEGESRQIPFRTLPGFDAITAYAYNAPMVRIL